MMKTKLDKLTLEYADTVERQAMAIDCYVTDLRVVADEMAQVVDKLKRWESANHNNGRASEAIRAHVNGLHDMISKLSETRDNMRQRAASMHEDIADD